MTTLRILACAVAIGAVAGLAAPGTASALDYRACVAKCKANDVRCQEKCEVAANNAMNEEGQKGACEGKEDPKTHVISFAHCK